MPRPGAHGHPPWPPGVQCPSACGRSSSSRPTTRRSRCPAVLKELPEQTPDFDVLVVSDGSDRPHRRARRAAAASTSRSCRSTSGIGGALRTGFRYAVRRRLRRAVQFDADGQHDPAHVATLLGRSTDGADMVIGSRFAEGGARHYDVERHPAAGDAGAAGGSCGCWCDSASPTPAPGSGPSTARCSSTSPATTRSSTWTRSRRWSSPRATGFGVEEVPVNMRHRAGGARQHPQPQARLLLRAAAGRAARRHHQPRPARRAGPRVDEAATARSMSTVAPTSSSSCSSPRR